MAENRQLQAALYYLNKCGLCVIPAKPDKKPFIDWIPFQQRKPTEEEVKQWWGKDFVGANIAIITGKISNLTVLDIDTEEGRTALNSITPKDFICPVAKTPSGGEHRYCLYQEGVSNKVRFIEGCDIRSEGGYVIAPPSKNGRGEWAWVSGLSITKIKPPLIPGTVLAKINSLSLSFKHSHVTSEVTDQNTEILFKQGSRDNDLFHVANCLVKGGMDPSKIGQVLGLIARKGCSPPFPEKEVSIKIQSALARADRRERNISQEIREWVLTSSGFFLTSDCFREMGLTSRDFQKAGTLALLKLVKEGVLEKHGQRRGQYRRIERQIVEQEWWEDDGEPLCLKWPLGVHEFARLYPGNVALIEGQKSQGKSAFAIEFCRLNYHLFDGKTLYQNVEMSQSEIKERFDSYGDLFPFEEARRAILFTKVHEAWWDRVQPNGLNVVDYLVEYEKPYMLADFVWKIHQKLDKGIALILIQRDPFKPYPKGGLGVRDIPRIIISLLNHQLKLEDVKSFNKTEWGNPTGLAVKYKHVNYCQFKYDSDWFRPEEEKYKFTDRKSTEVKYVNGSQ